MNQLVVPELGNTALVSKPLNSTYEDIRDVMTDPTFRQFFHKYFDTYTNAKAMVMMLKLYEFIEKKSPTSSTDEKLRVTQAVMSSSKLRAPMCKQYMAWTVET